MSDQFRVAILIVGFCNSQDVCECVAALSRAAPKPNFDIFICENGGVEYFGQLVKSLAESKGVCKAVSHDLPTSLTSPSERLVEIECFALEGRSSVVWVARAAKNFGYAGGLNAWIDKLLHVQDWDGIWILNPDCEPAPDALHALVRYSTNSNKGMVGSTLLPFKDPSRVHCRAGHHWRKFRTKLGAIGFHEPVDEPFDVGKIELRLDAISGASMYVTRACIDKIGLMDERFFLYYEDADWSMRAKLCGLGYASASMVQHKGGTTIGSAVSRADRSRLSVYLENRNRVHFVRRYFPWYLLLASIMSVLYASEYLVVGSPRNFWIAMMGLISGLQGEIGQPPESIFEV